MQNRVKIGLEKKTLRLVEVIHYVTDSVKLRKRDTKTKNMHFGASHRRVLFVSTKICMMVEDIRAII